MAEYSAQEKEWIWLDSIQGMNPVSFNKLINYYQDVGVTITSIKNDIKKLSFLTEYQKEHLLRSLNQGYADRVMELLEKHNIKAVSMISEEYPENLKHIYDPPPVLYCIGNVKLLNRDRMLGIIGSRTPTNYGIKTAKKISEDLARNGVCVVSGMAMGIDGSAHEGALKAEGDTIAVLGSGPEICYPECNRHIYNKIRETGLIVSEHIPTVQPLPFHFPARNRIITGLSKGILVVEAAKTSGTLKTIDHAQDQGRDVLAVPGNITSDKSYTPNHLIQEGCSLVIDYSDVMQWFGWRETEGGKDRSIHLESMDIQEQSVYNVIDNNGSRFDEIQFRLDYSPVQLISLLSRLELKELIVKLPGNKYIKT
ncbi:MAG: DNA-processing protein DprA [Clostridia bacterium]|nr:DNA-processing protein DprA [Clostridia bacterium]